MFTFGGDGGWGWGWMSVTLVCFYERVGWGWDWMESWGYLGSSHNWREMRVKWDEKTMVPLFFHTIILIMEITINNNFVCVYIYIYIYIYIT